MEQEPDSFDTPYVPYQSGEDNDDNDNDGKQTERHHEVILNVPVGPDRSRSIFSPEIVGIEESDTETNSDSDSDKDDDTLLIGMYGGQKKQKAGRQHVPITQVLRRIGFLDKEEKRLLLRWIESIYVQAIVFIVIIIDAVLSIMDWINDDFMDTITDTAITSVIITILTIEILMRLYALGFKPFFTNVWNFFEAIVMLVSIIVAIVAIEAVSYVVLARLIRLIARIIRVIVLMASRKQKVVSSVKHIVTENKLRYTKDGFDLDLAYLTDKVIIMSYPAADFVHKLYRNDIREVSRFMDTKHPDHYYICNSVSERDYPTHYFHDRVHRIRIDDHNVPTLSMMYDFAKWAHAYIEEDQRNVLAIHCKGGKGRTGVMACAYLLYAGICPSASNALTMFGEKRTDQTKKGRIQGVETASQRRYVNYFDRIMRNLDQRGGPVPNSIEYVVEACIVKISPSLGSSALDPSGKWRNWRLTIRTDCDTTSIRGDLSEQGRSTILVGHSSDNERERDDGVIRFGPSSSASDFLVKRDTRIELAAVHDNKSVVWLCGAWCHVGCETQPWGSIPANVPDDAAHKKDKGEKDTDTDTDALDGSHIGGLGAPKRVLHFTHLDLDRNRHLPSNILNPWKNINDITIELVLNYK